MKFTTLAMIGAAAGQAAENQSTNKCNRAGDCGKFPDTSCAFLAFEEIPMPAGCDQTCIDVIVAWADRYGVDKTELGKTVTDKPTPDTWKAGMELFNAGSMNSASCEPTKNCGTDAKMYFDPALDWSKGGHVAGMTVDCMQAEGGKGGAGAGGEGKEGERGVLKLNESCDWKKPKMGCIEKLCCAKMT